MCKLRLFQLVLPSLLGLEFSSDAMLLFSCFTTVSFLSFMSCILFNIRNITLLKLGTVLGIYACYYLV